MCSFLAWFSILAFSTSSVKDWILSERCKSCSDVCLNSGHFVCSFLAWFITLVCHLLVVSFMYNRFLTVSSFLCTVSKLTVRWCIVS